MRSRISLILAFAVGIVIPAWMATAATFVLCNPDAIYPTQTSVTPEGGAARWQAAAEVGLLVAFLSPFVAILLIWVSRRYARGQHTEMRNIWESIAGRALYPESGEEDALGVARSMAIEFGILRNSEAELKSKVIRLEHTLKEREHGESRRRAETEALTDAKLKADRACASLRDQIKNLEKKLDRFGQVEGDTWFAALVREVLAPFADLSPGGSNGTGEVAAERRVVTDLFKLADLSSDVRPDAFQTADLKDMLAQSIARMGNPNCITLRLKPEATTVLTNPVAFELLLDHILREVDRRGDVAMIRAWRERTAMGMERVRVAIERRDSSLENIVDGVAARGLATLAGTVIKTEHYDDERVAHVIYFDSAIVENLSGQNQAPRKVEPRRKALDEPPTPAPESESERPRRDRKTLGSPDTKEETSTSEGNGLRRRVKVLTSGEVRPVAAARTG